MTSLLNVNFSYYFIAIIVASYVINKVSFNLFEYAYIHKNNFILSFSIAVKKPLIKFIWIYFFLQYFYYLVETFIKKETKIIFFNINLLEVIDSIYYLCLLLLFFKVVKNYKKIYISRPDSDNIATFDTAETFLKIIIFLIWFLSLLNKFGINLNTLLAFGGFSSVIVGLAGKDIFSNIFNGLILYFEKPFSIGDHIILDEKGISGKVESINWRQTKILIKETNYPMYIPNSVFSTTTIQNRSKTKLFKFTETIVLKYDDFDKVEKIIDEIKKVLNEDYAINKRLPPFVGLDDIKNNYITLKIVAVSNTNSIDRFSTIKQNILLNIIKIIKDNGITEIPEFKLIK